MARHCPVFMPTFAPRLRLASIALLAAAVALPIALITLAKLLLFAVALVVAAWPGRRPADAVPEASHTARAAFGALALFALSLFWTTASIPEAMLALEKHGKLILIPLLLWLVRSAREARVALVAWMLGQAFLLTSSWLLAAHVPLPWAVARSPLNADVVFSTRLDQPIMTAVFAALCWHFRTLWGSRPAFWLSLAGCLLAVVNVLVLMDGGTGYLVMGLLIGLALLWEAPGRWRLPALVLAGVAFCGVLAASDGARERFAAAAQELHAYSPQHKMVERSSSGERLNFWRRSVQAIAERPLAGFGVGSWNRQYLRLDAGFGLEDQRSVRNPHQELLLWGVELGVLGMAAFAALMLGLWRDGRRMAPAHQRALLSVAVALLAACMLNSTLFDALIGDFFCVTLGVLLVLGLRGGTAESGYSGGVNSPQPS